MHIGIDIRPLMSPIRTGVGEYAYELLNAVFKIDKKNEYFLFYNSYKDVSPNIPVWKQENVHYVATRWPNKLFNACVRIVGRPLIDKMIIQHPPTPLRGGKYTMASSNRDLLLTPYSLHTWFSPNLNFTALSKNVGHILTIHDLSFELYPEFYSPKQRLWHKIINPKKQCRRADLILTPSENTKRDVVESYGINADKVRVIYPGLTAPPSSPPSERDPAEAGQGGSRGGVVRNERHTQPHTPLPPSKGGAYCNQPYILFLGTVELRKNVIGIIEAYELARRSLNGEAGSYHLIIAGADGYGAERIKKRARQSPLRDRIKFLGYIPPEDKPALYANASLFVFPSFYEGFGFPVLEAMAAGVPVICSNRSSLPEVAENAAYLINPNNIASIVEGMARLAGDENLRVLHTQRGFEQTKKFHWKKTAEEWLNTTL